VYNEQAVIGIMFCAVASSLSLTSRVCGQYQCQQWFFFGREGEILSGAGPGPKDE
jgi:hypothetical protein